MKENSLLKGSAIFEKYIRKNFLKYVGILFIYVTGFLIGIGIFNNTISTEENATSIFQNVTEKIETIGDGTSEITSNYIKQDFLEVIIICILSFSVIGIPIIVILAFISSISLGVTVSALIHTNGVGSGLSFSILVFMIPTIIKIFILLILACSSIKFIENILKYKKEIKYEIVRHAFTNLIVLLLTCILAVYRTFSLNIVSQILF